MAGRDCPPGDEAGLLDAITCTRKGKLAAIHDRQEISAKSSIRERSFTPGGQGVRLSGFPAWATWLLVHVRIW